MPGLRYKVDSNHDLVYLELDEPTITSREIRSDFSQTRISSRVSSARFRRNCGAKPKTQLLSI